MIKSIREICGGKDQGERTVEWRYYVSSRQADAAEFNAKVRAHWGIENGCHWVLDVTFNGEAAASAAATARRTSPSCGASRSTSSSRTSQARAACAPGA